jgi:Cdc6-like AAA superfamily ATPase
VTPEEIFEEMLGGVEESGQTEYEIVHELIRDLKDNEIRERGALTDESVALLSSSLHELKDAVSTALTNLDELRSGTSQLKEDAQNFIKAMDGLEGMSMADARAAAANIARDYRNLMASTLSRL